MIILALSLMSDSEKNHLRTKTINYITTKISPFFAYHNSIDAINQHEQIEMKIPADSETPVLENLNDRNAAIHHETPVQKTAPHDPGVTGIVNNDLSESDKGKPEIDKSNQTQDASDSTNIEMNDKNETTARSE